MHIVSYIICITYSESLGRALSHGASLSRSYQFKMLKNTYILVSIENSSFQERAPDVTDVRL